MAIGAVNGRLPFLVTRDARLHRQFDRATRILPSTQRYIAVTRFAHNLTELDVAWLSRKLGLYGMEAPNGVENIKKIVAGRQLWNYDNLEPSEKKLIL